MSHETKVIYYLDEEPTPYMIKVPVDSSNITLGDIKGLFVKSNCKYFFKSLDADFGFVKEEICDSSARLPNFNGQFICWLVSVDKSTSDTRSQIGGSLRDVKVSPNADSAYQRTDRHQTTRDESRWVATSDIDSASFVGSNSGSETHGRSYDGDVSSRQCSKYRTRPDSRASSSCSSLTGSGCSLTVITVTLSVGSCGCLGISIADPAICGSRNIGGVYVGSVIEGGPAALDGHIGVGDVILEVNGVSLENMCDAEAVHTLRQVLQNQSQVTLLVAKRPLSNNQNQCYVPDHLTSLNMTPCLRTLSPPDVDSQTGIYHIYQQVTPWSVGSTRLSPTPSLIKSVPLTIETDRLMVVQAMALPNSGLKVCDRTWLKIIIPRAFIGSDLVKWLLTHVEGLSAHRDAKKYATSLLKAGYIRHTTNKSSFSEKCYYVFGEAANSAVNVSDINASFHRPINNDSITMPAGSITGSSNSSLRCTQDISADQTPLLHRDHPTAEIDGCTAYSRLPPHLPSLHTTYLASSVCSSPPRDDFRLRHSTSPVSGLSRDMELIGDV